MLAAVVARPAAVGAATYRNWIAQVPVVPTSSQSVRVWMDSDTALGETAGLEYNVGSNYIKAHDSLIFALDSRNAVSYWHERNTYRNN
jgi:hypothetical protein